MAQFTQLQSKNKEGEGGGIEDASGRSFEGERWFFVPLTPLSRFFPSSLSYHWISCILSQEYVCIPQNIFFLNNEESFN